ncbi:YebC/PmpR family DNA-binding transcriptional regulator [soil metagenome]
MAGHNKWSKIKHRKAVVDKRRGKAWSMCSRAIISAVRQGGPDPAFNFALRAALDEAKYHNVPADNIERAIRKGAGGAAGDNFELARYEGYGPGGVAVIVDALTDNRTRTAANVRNIFDDFGGKLGVAGCVAHMFAHKGRFEVSAPAREEDRVIELALAAGADDVRSVDEGTFEVLCAPERVGAVHAGLKAAGLTLSPPATEMIPHTLTRVEGEHAEGVSAMLEELEDDEDVKKVFSNGEIEEAE